MPDAPAAPPYTSLDALQAAHDGLLDATDADRLDAAAVERVREFLRRAAATGSALDTAADRKAAQGLMDYWAASLYTASRLRKDNIVGGERLPAGETVLAPFAAASARAAAAAAAAWYDALPAADQAGARRLLMRLVQMPADGSVVAARPVRLSQLNVAPADVVERVLAGLGAAGAVAVARPELPPHEGVIAGGVIPLGPEGPGPVAYRFIQHGPPPEAVVTLRSEALTRDWPQYVAWLSGRLKFRAAAELWAVSRRREDFLGERSVAEAEEYHDLNATEGDFLRESRAELNRLRDAKLRQLEEQAALLAERDRARVRADRRRKHRILLGWLLAGCLGVCLVAVVWALEAEKSESAEHERALKEAIKARQRRGLAVRVARNNEGTEAELAEAYRHLAAGTRPEGVDAAARAREIADRLRFAAELRASQVVRPGTSIGRGDKNQGNCGSICSVVHDTNNHKYLVTASEAVAGSEGGERRLIQPSYLDAGPRPQGSEPPYQHPLRTVAAEFETDNEFGCAWAKLYDIVAASNDVPGLGPIRGVATPEMYFTGSEIVVVGCGSGLRRGRRLDEKPPDGSPLGTLVAERITVPGDGGGPALVKQADGYYLVGVVYRIQVDLSRPAGDDRTLIVPIEPFLKRKGLKLLQE